MRSTKRSGKVVELIHTQHHAMRMRNLYHRDRVLLPSPQPASRALLRSQGGPHGGAWLAAVPSEPAVTLGHNCPCPCAPTGCGKRVDAYGDHAFACPRTGPTGKSFPQNGWHTPRRWECRPTTADGFDPVVYGATPQCNPCFPPHLGRA